MQRSEWQPLVLKIDMHIHTCYSNDSSITTKELIFYSEKQNLDGVAIVDHDTIDGLDEFCKIKDLLVIPGVEITTSQGHILAINVNTNIRSGLSFTQTIDEIHDVGGLAIVAHPKALVKGVLKEKLMANCDALEVINASAIPFMLSKRKNKEIAKKLNLPQIGGSDAHYAPEIGMAYTSIKASANVDSVVEAIIKGAVAPFGRSIPYNIRLKREFLKIKRRLIRGVSV